MTLCQSIIFIQNSKPPFKINRIATYLAYLTTVFGLQPQQTNLLGVITLHLGMERKEVYGNVKKGAAENFQSSSSIEKRLNI